MTAPEVFDQIADAVSPGSVVARRWSLTGGVSATVDAIELTSTTGTTRTVVVKQHKGAALEFTLLRALADSALEVPAVHFVDTSLQRLRLPYFVMDFVAGTTEVDTSQSRMPSSSWQRSSFVFTH